MGASKHTPGPWEVRFRFGRLTTVSGRQRYPICDTGTAPLGEANHVREEANARLIAAAPDLLEAAKAFVAGEDALLAELRADGQLPDLTEKPWSLVDGLRAAIAKATPSDPEASKGAA